MTSERSDRVKLSLWQPDPTRALYWQGNDDLAS